MADSKSSSVHSQGTIVPARVAGPEPISEIDKEIFTETVYVPPVKPARTPSETLAILNGLIEKGCDWFTPKRDALMAEIERAAIQTSVCAPFCGTTVPTKVAPRLLFRSSSDSKTMEELEEMVGFVEELGFGADQSE